MAVDGDHAPILLAVSWHGQLPLDARPPASYNHAMATPASGSGRDRQPDGAQTRDHLANERTLLSWTRLGLAISTFGFVVARFGLFLRELSGTRAPARSAHLSEWLGVVLVLAGPFLAVMAAARFFHIEREIDRGTYSHRYTLILGILSGSVLLGLGLAGYLLWSGR